MTELLSWEEACEDERSLTLLCGEDACAFVRCRDVEDLTPGEVVRVRGGTVAPPGRSAQVVGARAGAAG